MDSTAGGSSNDGNISLYTRKEIFLIVKGHLQYSIADLLEHLSAEISKKGGHSVTIADNAKQFFSTLFNKMRTKWQSANRHEGYFFKKHAKWLDVQVSFPVPGPSRKTPALIRTVTRGRPSSEFDSSSFSTGDHVLLYTRKEVFHMAKGRLKDALPDLLEYLAAEISKKSGLLVLIPDDMKPSFSTLFNKMRTKWKLANRHEKYFYTKYEQWLEVHVSFPVLAPYQKTPSLIASAARCRPAYFE